MDPDKPLPSAPPPTYSESVGNNMVHPLVAHELQDNVIVLQQPIQTTTVIIVQEKYARSFESYQEECPRCQTMVQTRVDYQMGFCSWLMFFLGIFLFCPLLCCFCCQCCKDAKHYCPKCNMLIATKKR
ncbi:unnamed protein product [Caenorhabditis angaria]|uniref:LITAF domain-containing protein n=1 Tax=Caenorhabditis angaria TaxID=860376 RepID=A0A9P1IHJ6_9PELO|nr:unnamed protein product [Caenorhabditis angaria]